jgi:PAS domain-containing protein
MDEHKHEQELVEGFFNEQKEIFDSSNQAIYAFLDDAHKICNEKFASLLGYSSKEEWAGVQEAFPVAFVKEESRHALVEAYQNAMEHMAGATIKVTWKKKSGDTVDTTVILVPIAYKGQVFALHFIS